MWPFDEPRDGGRKSEFLANARELAQIQLARPFGRLARIEVQLDLNERMPREEIRPRQPARGLEVPQSPSSRAMRTPRSS
jgi:hypothetical protein